MNNFTSYSQSGQDRFVYELLIKPNPGYKGTFLDIGFGHPITLNNTYALELLGWTGLLIDRSDRYIDTASKFRTSRVVNACAITYPWQEEFYDYVSLDVDENSWPTLENMPLDKVKFKVLTIEHDKYSRGPQYQQKMREKLLRYGYKLICADVCDLDMAYEDWWVSPELEELAHKFKCDGKDYKDIFKE